LERSMRLLSHFPKTDCGRREWTEWSRGAVDALGSGSNGFIEGVRTSSSAILPACRLSRRSSHSALVEVFRVLFTF
jgi:hypothetical protein